MANIKILDCTLRDGGYINNWNFGEKVIKKIFRRLSDANIDIVECGFLSEGEYDSNKTIFNEVSQIADLLPEKKLKYVAMVALGEKEIAHEKIAKCDGQSIFGIRLTFHKHEIDRAFDYAKNLMEKGYEVFIQPVGTCSYTDLELLELVERVNTLKPYAFSIVDTLGTITGKELMRLFQMVDNNLDESIRIGFHSHNNLQLAFSNAQELMQTFTKREIIIDASVQGMGRGAGNLCTELIAQFMNDNLGSNYNVTALLEIIDRYLVKIQESNPWGYMIPYYISAVNGCHPNYATYLINKQTLNVRDIEKIINEIPFEKRPLFDKELIAELYKKYQESQIDDTISLETISNILKDKEILILAPGPSLTAEEQKIKDYITQKNPYVISINFINELFENDMIFISNLKRFEDLDLMEIKNKHNRLVVTSNISINPDEYIYRVNYSSYLNTDKLIFDDAGLMLLNLLKKCCVKKVSLAGFDGFSNSGEKQFYFNEAGHSLEPLLPEDKTTRIALQIEQLRSSMDIQFITTSLYDKENM